MLKPQIIEKIVDPNTNETVYESKVEASEQIVSSSTVKKMRELMYNTVNGNDAGTTGTLYRIDGYDVIGKTGTAEIYDQETSRYLSGNDNYYLFSFAGMFPKDDPEIIVYAVMEKPTWNKSYGISEVVNNVTKSIVKYKNMFTPEKEKKTFATYKLESFINDNVDEVASSLSSKNITPIVLGNGKKVIDQYPKAGTEVISYDKVFLLTNDLKLTMPSLVGYTRSQAIAVAELLGIDYEIVGYGKVTDQSIAVGSEIKKGDKVLITLEDKTDFDGKT